MGRKDIIYRGGAMNFFSRIFGGDTPEKRGEKLGQFLIDINNGDISKLSCEFPDPYWGRFVLDMLCVLPGIAVATTTIANIKEKNEKTRKDFGLKVFEAVMDQ